VGQQQPTTEVATTAQAQGHELEAIDLAIQETVQEIDNLHHKISAAMARLHQLTIQRTELQLPLAAGAGGLLPDQVRYSLCSRVSVLPPLVDFPLSGCGGVFASPMAGSVLPPVEPFGPLPYDGGLGGGFWRKRDANPCWGLGGCGGLPLGGYGYGAYPAYPYYPYGGYGGLGLSFYGRGGYYGLY
jgi:hypothetical protein